MQYAMTKLYFRDPPSPESWGKALSGAFPHFVAVKYNPSTRQTLIWPLKNNKTNEETRQKAGFNINYSFFIIHYSIFIIHYSLKEAPFSRLVLGIIPTYNEIDLRCKSQTVEKDAEQKPQNIQYLVKWKTQ